MDEWMHLTGGEAAYRRELQRALYRDSPTQRRIGLGRRVRTALAAALVALATRIAPAPGYWNGESLAPTTPA